MQHWQRARVKAPTPRDPRKQLHSAIRQLRGIYTLREDNPFTTSTPLLNFCVQFKALITILIGPGPH